MLPVSQSDKRSSHQASNPVTFQLRVNNQELDYPKDDIPKIAITLITIVMGLFRLSLNADVFASLVCEYWSKMYSLNYSAPHDINS